MGAAVIVPDASVLVKWALKSDGERDGDCALAIRDQWISGKCRIVVPSLWVYEVGNVFSLKAPSLAGELLQLMMNYQFEEISPVTLFRTILEIVHQAKVTFYDAAYHAAALELEGTFVTADEKYFQRTVRLGGVALLRHWS